MEERERKSTRRLTVTKVQNDVVDKFRKDTLNKKVIKLKGFYSQLSI